MAHQISSRIIIPSRRLIINIHPHFHPPHPHHIDVRVIRHILILTHANVVKSVDFLLLCRYMYG